MCYIVKIVKIILNGQMGKEKKPHKLVAHKAILISIWYLMEENKLNLTNNKKLKINKIFLTFGLPTFF